MIQCPSPNFDDRPAGANVKYLILHYTGMATGQAALDRLCNGRAKVSAHYLIEEDGRIFALVGEDMRAWHAGVSSWEGETDINGLSIGIELVNPGHDTPGYKGDYRPFPDQQVMSLIGLCQDILARHDIRPCHVLGHSDVAPGRKSDPGELFDWQRLADAGIGIWPSDNIPHGAGAAGELAAFQQKLADFGYGIDVTGLMDPQTISTVRAFQRHFRPGDIAGNIDRECHEILNSLLRLKG